MPRVHRKKIKVLKPSTFSGSGKQAYPSRNEYIWLSDDKATLYLWGGEHAGLEIKDGRSGRKMYITWRQSGNASAVDSGIGFHLIDENGRTINNQGSWIRDHNTPINLVLDRANNRNSTERVVHIPCMSSTIFWGLDSFAVWNYWKRIMQLPPKHPRRLGYDDAGFDNSVGIIVSALQEGWKGLFDDGIGDGDGIFAFLPPSINQLKVWVESSLKQINQLNEQYEAPLYKFSNRKDLPIVTSSKLQVKMKRRNLKSLTAWITDSKVSWGRRRGQVKKIDQLLPLYHAANRSKLRLFYLTKIELEVIDHLEKKPKSDRRKAVLRLYGEVLYCRKILVGRIKNTIKRRLKCSV